MDLREEVRFVVAPTSEGRERPERLGENDDTIYIIRPLVGRTTHQV